MNKKLFASFLTHPQLVSVPEPAMFTLWLRVHMEAIPTAEDGTTLSVQIEGVERSWQIAKKENVSHKTSENMTLLVPEKHYEKVLKHLSDLGCGTLTTEDAVYCSVWVEGCVAGFITVKKKK